MASHADVLPVEDLQSSGRLLLRHITRRFDKTLAAGVFPEVLAADVALLTTTPEAILCETNGFGRLARCVDELSRRAAPANVNTIRLTCAYLKTSDDDVPGDTRVGRRAGSLRQIFVGVFVLAFAVTILSVFLLAHVDSGRRSAQQLQEANAELKVIFGELSKMPGTAWLMSGAEDVLPDDKASPDTFKLPFLPFCESGGGEKVPLNPAGTAIAPKADWVAPGKAHWAPRASAEGIRSQVLCSQWSQASLREQLVYLRLQEWNCKSDRLRSAFLDDCKTLPDSPPPRINLDHWRRTELRTAAVISSLTGFVLPMALGCIGGCAYVLRRLDRKLAAFTLDENDGMHAILRVLLATMLGGLLGVIWSADQQVQVGGFTLSLAAAAFFVGFALEVVFSTIEAMVEGVASKVRTA